MHALHRAHTVRLIPRVASHHSTTPSAWITRFAPLLPSGPVLDLAAGSGRHTRLLRTLGHPVTAIDRDLGALPADAASPPLTRLEFDLEGERPWPLPGATFAAVVVTNYLHRPLFPQLLLSVAPGGWLLYETFAIGNERFGRPSNPHFLLQPGELLEVVRGTLDVVAFEHGEVAVPQPAVIQHIAARRSV